jgi:hypothetical protein
VALLPEAIDPRLQVIALVPLHDPWLLTAETKMSPPGKLVVRTAPLEAEGPLFFTVIK